MCKHLHRNITSSQKLTTEKNSRASCIMATRCQLKAPRRLTRVGFMDWSGAPKRKSRLNRARSERIGDVDA
ncbi:hypothetical protein DPMN_176707 [Dreissena polymorpha]|uniref:Uncharacterized protein n=1 Tax=Dreissena polymorpha TaxID=45954 RepID=A0A9D4E8T3_DREPO|nr:hypothetical protein DPMN_176707 [Dreissena polymorpha]